MERTLRILRLWIIPILSLAATMILPACFPYPLLIIWPITFVCVCEGGPSAAAMVRPTFWVCLHLAAMAPYLFS